jgi:glyoxylase-like metal-dependent hydrolase (beta-lactamase superfamily II)/8-oxo-dGTP pyrophosphatase MutT (NUDIX family)
MTAEPKAAAACIVVRGHSSPEVLLVRRNPALKFMGGHHVFPGGRLQDDDKIARVFNANDVGHARSLLAAVREVFEETGLLCVRGALPPREEIGQARRRHLAGEVSFHALLEHYSLAVDAMDFELAGQWLTPPFVPIRFATQYFLHRLREGQQAELIEGEIVALDWLSPAEARARWHKGQLHISTPVAYTLRQMAAVGLPDAIPLLQRGTERAPGEHNWFEIRRGITLVPVKSLTLPPATHTNCIIVGEQELFVIDPGAHEAAEQQHLNTQIDHLLELGGTLRAILLSHSHPDHIAGAEVLRARYGVPIWGHPATAAQLPQLVDRHLHEGDVLTSAGSPRWELQCLHTPGHDPGHLCFLERSTGALLAGDMVANPGSILVAREYGGDMADFMQSLERLLAIDCKFIVPAHGHPTGQPRAFIQQQLDHRRWREAKVRRAYDSGARTFEALLDAAYDDAPRPALVWARHSLDAHLHKLGIEVPAGE